MTAHKPDSISQIMSAAALAGAALGFVSPLPLSPASAPKPVTATAKTAAFQAKVIHISDGDTLTVRVSTTDVEDENIKIRLAQIDAPERGQPWGTRSKQEIARMVDGKTVMILPQSTDRYGRTIAQVEIDGTDVNRQMVALGAAWAYRDYMHDASLLALENKAKTTRQGLWAMPENERIPPWEYRAMRRAAAGVAAGR
jgi:endonuclease YncB( thermonuclease family)